MDKKYEGLILALKSRNFDLYIQSVKTLLPQNIYRYFEHNNNTIDSILNKEIALSNPQNFNDPYDSVANAIDLEVKRQRLFIDTTIRKILYHSSDMVVNELKEAILSKNILTSSILYNEKAKVLKEQITILCNKYSEFQQIELKKVTVLLGFIFGFTNKFIGDFVSNSAIACFSEAKNDLLMWAHYGKNCSGICIEYSTETIIENILKKNFYFVPIIYSDQFYSDYGSSPISEKTLSFLWNLPQFMYKHSRWAYEKEWRLIILETNLSKVETLPVKHIYLGSGFKPFNQYKKNEEGHDEENQLKKYIELVNYAKNNSIPISAIQPRERSYDFDLR